jgi:putative two-component system response regulator
MTGSGDDLCRCPGENRDDPTHLAPGFLTYAIQIARHHHERWDGCGYPDGLAGTAIPLAARLMAIADVFDALISKRVYKEPMPRAMARDIMACERGSLFDPELLDVFLANFDAFCVIAQRHPDEQTEGVPEAATVITTSP